MGKEIEVLIDHRFNMSWLRDAFAFFFFATVFVAASSGVLDVRHGR